MSLTKIKKLIYKILIDNHENISLDFREFMEQGGRNRDYFEAAVEILKLNLKYRILKRESDCRLDKLLLPESRITQLPSKTAVIKRLARYDVISFDVFDTLIFRAVSTPRDVFRLLEAEWNIMNFAKKREEAERKAREKKAEVTIYDIYRILSNELNIDVETAVSKEIEAEKKVCFANPYMKGILDGLEKKKKTIVFISDMYLPKNKLLYLLKECGYHIDGNSIFVSCDYKKGKAKGGLQKIVMKKLGKYRSYIHVGDHQVSDIYGSRRAGWDTFYYPNISMAGSPYRRKEMQTLAASFYKGLVNTKLHSGAFRGDEYYECGYCYGGVLAVGFCQYLKELAGKEKFDQFLFLARDGYMLYKIYDKFLGEIDSEYLPFSRFASYQLTIERTWEEMLQNVVLPKIKETAKKDVREVLQSCDLLFLEQYFHKYKISFDQKFDWSVYQKLHDLFENHIAEIRENYTNTVLAAQKYLQAKIGHHKKICIVDVGWQGTSIMCLKYFLEEKCGLDVHVCGALMGMIKNESAELRLAKGDIFSYLFSPHHNEKTYRRHMGKCAEIPYRNMLLEILFTQDQPSFLKFQLDQEGNVIFEYGLKENNGKILKSLQKGIMDFAKDYIKYWGCFGDVLKICGQEAYIPIDSLAQAKKDCMKLFGHYEIKDDPGIFGEKDRRTYKEVIENE